MNTVRLATFNVKHGAPADGKFWGNPELVAEACASLGADILALQEVDQKTWRVKGADVIGMIADATYMEPYFAPTMQLFGGEYGNALFVRGVKNAETIDLPAGYRHRLGKGVQQIRFGCEPRNAIVATTRVIAGRLSVAATHLAVERDIAKKQLPIVATALGKQTAHQVLLGDLNVTGKRILQEPSLADMELVGAGATYRADDPARKSRIDHIAVRGLTIQSAETRQFAFSDHSALIADVVLA